MDGGAEHSHACHGDATRDADIYQDIRHIRSREGCERGHRYGCDGKYRTGPTCSEARREKYGCIPG